MVLSPRSTLIVACAAAFLLAGSSSLFSDDGDHGHGRSAKLTGPAGSEARGVVVLGRDSLSVVVEGLAAGDYNVLLDDGTGTKAGIGTITVVAEDEDDDDEHEGDGGSDDGEEHEDNDTRGSLKLSVPNLPFGAASPADLAGRAICVTDKDGNVVLSGTTPTPIVEEPEHRNGRCPLTRPDPAVDEDAEGAIKVESGEGRIVIKVHLSHLDAGKVYEVILTNPADGKSESLGKVTISDDGEGHLKVDSSKGDSIPFGAGSLDALKGFGVSVNDPDGKTVLTGTICDAPVHDDGDDDDDHDGDHEDEHGCEADLSRPDPAVDEDASGEVESSSRKLEVEVENLAADATYDVVLTNPADSSTQTIGQIKTDAEGKGKLEVEAAEGETLAFGGFGVAVVDASGAAVLLGTVPAGPCGDDDDEHHDGEHHDDEHEGEHDCEAALSLPDPAVDADASGEVESSSRELEVKVENLAADSTYDVVLTNPADSSTQTVGQIKTDAEGKGKLEVEAAEGTTLAFGGFGVAVVDASGAKVLLGTVPVGPCGDEEEHDGEGGGAAVAPAQDEPIFLMTTPFDEAFLRGDTNRDGNVDISDAVATLLYLFSGGARPYCMDAADANDDGRLDITDPISLLGYLFMGAKGPASPGTTVPGSDPTADSLYCEENGV